jgi:tRNA(Ile)-lysidine synthase
MPRSSSPRSSSARDEFPRDNFRQGFRPDSRSDSPRGGRVSRGNSLSRTPSPAPKERIEPRAEKPIEKRLEPQTESRVVNPFIPQFPASFATLENESLYLQPASTAPLDAALRDIRAEQALMRYVAEKQGQSSPQTILRFVPSDDEKVAASQELTAKPALKRPVSRAAEHPEENRLENRASSDSVSAPKPARRTQLPDEPDHVKSPFGDIIETIQEVLIARNSGRYVPSPKSAEKPRPPGVDLHPAIGFKMYAPNPHKPVHAQPRRAAQRFPNRPERIYPAAVPPDAVFDTMPSAAYAFHERLQRVLHFEAEMPSSAEVVVAVSGGVDSIVLLDMLMCLARRNDVGKRNLQIAVVHFNHRLRGVEAENDANFVRETCKRYDIPCYIAWADVERFAEIQSMTLEQAGRELRYKFLEFIAYKRRADAVLTAHTLNDSVETVLMNMLRGSGLTGLSGIPAQRPFGEHTKLLRPLLGMKKAEIQEYAALRGLSWREDASNSQSVFRRNKIRNELLPLLEREYSSGIVDVLHRTSQIISGAEDIVRDAVERAMPTALIEDEFQPYIGLTITSLRVQKHFLQTEMVRRVVQRRFGLALSFDAVDRVLALMDAEVGTKADIMRGFIALRDRTAILLSPAPGVHNLNVRVEKNNRYDFGGWQIILEEIDRKNVKFTADPAVEFLDTRLLPYRLTLRTWQPGDVFTPLGMKGTMKVSDYLTNSKISFFNRQNILVLTAAMPEGEQVVWLCGLRLSDPFRLAPDAHKALRLEFRRPKGIVLPMPPQEKG